MSRNTARCLVSAIALAIVPLFARSQSSANTSPQQLASLDPVVVTASRFEESLADVPAFAQVISKDEIVQSAVTSVPEAVNRLGNINVRSMLGGPLGILTDIDMRGFGASARDNTLILVDGMRVSPIDSGPILWESIPIGLVERIEIIHGGGSVQYGDKAVGGVINIITRGDLSQPSTASVTVGSYGSVLSNASLVTGSGSTRAKIDIVANTSDGWRENSQARQGAVRGLLSHSLGGGGKLFLEAALSSQQYHSPGGVLGEVNTGDRRAAKFNNVGDKTTTDASRGLVGLSKSFGDGWQFLAEALYSNSDSTQVQPYYAGDGKLKTSGKTWYDKWSYDVTPRLKKIWDAKNDSVLGFDYQRASASYRTDTNGGQQTADIENKSFYLSHKHLITPALELGGGVRRQVQDSSAHDNYVKYKADGNTVDLVNSRVTTAAKRHSANAVDAALTYRFGDGHREKFFVRSNRSYRFANTDEFWGFDSQTYERTFAGILRPQKADTIEFGGSWSVGGTGVFSATVFNTETKDEIRYDDYGGTNKNFPKIQRYGAAFLSQFSLSRQLVLRSGLTLQESKYRDGYFTYYDPVNFLAPPVDVPLTGRKVPLAPEILANVGLVYDVNNSVSYRMNVRYVGSQYYSSGEYGYADWASARLMPAYVLTDVGARYQKGKIWEADFQIRNLTNKKYANYGGYGFVDLPGGLNSNSYYYYPGDPRTLWLSARYKFN